MSVGLVDLRPDVPPTERTVWKMQKDSRVIEARLRDLPYNLLEVRINVNAMLRWSCVYTDHREAEAAAAYKRTILERLGWHVAPTPYCNAP